MTVHARGYRRYEGGWGAPPAWWVILRSGVATTTQGRGMRFLGLLMLLYFVILGVALYIQVSALTEPRGYGEPRSAMEVLADSRRVLVGTLLTFYSGVIFLVSLLAIFSGAGLVAEDLHARALTLYLVRPLRAVDYALGKALVVPWVLLVMAAAPGLAFWLLVGAWQMPGATLTFWEQNLDLLGLVARFLLVAGGAFSGLILLLSASTPRRGVVSALAATAIFGGMMVYGIGSNVRGTAGGLLRLVGLPMDAIVPFVHAMIDESHRLRWARSLDVDRYKEHFPDPDAAAVLAALLFVAGFVRVWVRARSVEVTE